MAPKIEHKISEFAWQQANDAEEDADSNQPGRLRTILSRAALLYLGLFMGLSLFLAIFDIDPLIHNGVLPRCLLVYVGLAVALALANGEANLVKEQTRAWLVLYGYRPLREHSPRRETER